MELSVIQLGRLPITMMRARLLPNLRLWMPRGLMLSAQHQCSSERVKYELDLSSQEIESLRKEKGLCAKSLLYCSTKISQKNIRFIHMLTEHYGAESNIWSSGLSCIWILAHSLTRFWYFTSSAVLPSLPLATWRTHWTVKKSTVISKPSAIISVSNCFAETKSANNSGPFFPPSSCFTRSRNVFLTLSVVGVAVTQAKQLQENPYGARSVCRSALVLASLQ